MIRRSLRPVSYTHLQAADRFLQTYPNHANADYVMYLKALATLNETDSWFNKLAGEDLAERDANASREAFDIFKDCLLYTSIPENGKGGH